jgi:hypothetical protein
MDPLKLMVFVLLTINLNFANGITTELSQSVLPESSLLNQNSLTQYLSNVTYIPTDLISPNFYFELQCCTPYLIPPTPLMYDSHLCMIGNRRWITSLFTIESCIISGDMVLAVNIQSPTVYYGLNSCGTTMVNFQCEQANGTQIIMYSVAVNNSYGSILINNTGYLQIFDPITTGDLIDLDNFQTESFVMHFNRTIPVVELSFSAIPVITNLQVISGATVLDSIANVQTNAVSFQKTITTVTSSTVTSSQTTQQTNSLTLSNTVSTAITSAVSSAFSTQSASGSSQSFNMQNVLVAAAPGITDTNTINIGLNAQQSSSASNSGSSSSSSATTTTNEQTQLESLTSINSQSFSNTFQTSVQELYQTQISPQGILQLLNAVTTSYEILNFSSGFVNVTACFILEGTCVTYPVDCPFIIQNIVTVSGLTFSNGLSAKFI